MYYLAFPQDGWNRKVVVCLTLLIESTQTVLATYDAFRQLASGWGNPVELDDIGLYWFSIIILTGISGFICQLFYAWRICMLSRSYWIPGLIFIVGVRFVLVLTRYQSYTLVCSC